MPDPSPPPSPSFPPAGAGGVTTTATTEPAPLPPGYSPDVVAERSMSRWTLRQKIARVLWMYVWGLLFRPSFHNWYAWRRMLLRCFGAKLGRNVLVRPTVWVEIPWNLEVGDYSAFGDGVILYSLDKIVIGKLSIVSQYAHLCTGTHDHTLRTFPLVRKPIRVGDEAWVATDVFVGPGVTIGDRSIVGARATVVKDVPAGRDRRRQPGPGGGAAGHPRLKCGFTTENTEGTEGTEKRRWQVVGSG